MAIETFGGSCDGRQHVCLASEEAVIWLPLSEARSSFSLAAAMRARGMPVGDPADQRDLLGRIRGLKDFPPVEIATASGWGGDRYMFSSGRGFGPKGAEQPNVSFPISSELQLAGTLTRWKQEVALQTLGRPLALFLLMLGFLAPLLRFMPLVPAAVVEVVGVAGRGKGTLRSIVSSMFGGTGMDGSPPYWRSIEAVVDKLDEVILSCRDRLVILDGIHLLPHLLDPKKLRKPYVTLAFNVGRGDLAACAVSGRAAPYRGVVLLIGRESMRDVSGKESIGEDLLITLPIPVGWEVSPGGSDRAAVSEAIAIATAANHGHAFQRFVKALVRRLSKDRDGITSRLEGWQAEFLARAGADRNAGSDHSRARIFAAAYAAGRLAQHLGVLPRELKCGPAALTCYELYRAHNKPRMAFIDRLEALAASDEILHVTNRKDDRQSQLAETALGTLVVTPTHRELRIPRHNIGRAFADWKAIWKTEEVRREMVPADKPQLKPKCRLAPGMPVKRHWCFKLPLLEAPPTEPPLIDED